MVPPRATRVLSMDSGPTACYTTVLSMDSGPTARYTCTENGPWSHCALHDCTENGPWSHCALHDCTEHGPWSHGVLHSVRKSTMVCSISRTVVFFSCITVRLGAEHSLSCGIPPLNIMYCSLQPKTTGVSPATGVRSDTYAPPILPKSFVKATSGGKHMKMCLEGTT